MKYISVSDFAKIWNVPERTVRYNCEKGKLEGAFLTGKTWNIPEDSEWPDKTIRQNKSENHLLKILKEQKEMKLKGGIYHRTQIDLTYSSNRIEGSMLSHDQTRFIFETNTLGPTVESTNVDDVIETSNHFRCVDMIIEKANAKLSEAMIKELHFMLKSGTSDARKDWFNVGGYKKLPNEVGGNETCLPELVDIKMKELLSEYHQKRGKTLTDIIDFHHKFEMIHPFQDGNGRVGRLILFKECLANNIIPFIITEDLKFFYYRGLQEWQNVKEYLAETCLTAQDNYKNIMNYFRINEK
ncbi:MAG: Fic family protein [Bacteroidetes bacterium]|nr:Fic family protein [Bacteroidota bacterium]